LSRAQAEAARLAAERDAQEERAAGLEAAAGERDREKSTLLAMCDELMNRLEGRE
ncbi:hypothetical protein H632_c1830p0, partial [Helicosporidium sp. ATCC 50920]